MADSRTSDLTSLKLRRADHIAPVPTSWLIQDWLIEETIAGLVGPSGSCKSFLAIDWACCVATGTPWNGCVVKPRPVCYLAGEGQYGLRKRIAAWEKAKNKSIAGAPLYISAGLPSLCDDWNAVAAIDDMNAATLAGPSLIVLDTVARAMGGRNENSAEDMGAFIRACDRFRLECRATVLSIHHTGVNPSEQGRARGSSAYRAALDSEFLMRPEALEVVLSTIKAKDWESPNALRLRKQVVELDIGSVAETSLTLEQSNHARPVPKDKWAEAHRRRTQGDSLRKIAAATGVAVTTLHRWFRTESPEPVPFHPLCESGVVEQGVPRNESDGTERNTRNTVGVG